GEVEEVVDVDGAELVGGRADLVVQGRPEEVEGDTRVRAAEVLGLAGGRGGLLHRTVDQGADEEVAAVLHDRRGPAGGGPLPAAPRRAGRGGATSKPVRAATVHRSGSATPAGTTSGIPRRWARITPANIRRSSDPKLTTLPPARRSIAGSTCCGRLVVKKNRAR